MEESAPIPFEAVLFDLDGTLVATDRYWLPAAREGSRRALRELGLERALPGDAAWLAMVGQPLDHGFRAAFPDLDERARALLMRRCQEQELARIEAGEARPLPGVPEALEELRRAGLRLGIASNCSGPYLEAVSRVLGLGRWIHAARCLASPGVRDKADMVGELLAVFGTRAAVVVGDRASDARAARAHGLPCVHVRAGYAADEPVPCEASIAAMDALVPCLRGLRPGAAPPG